MVMIADTCSDGAGSRIRPPKQVERTIGWDEGTFRVPRATANAALRLAAALEHAACGHHVIIATAVAITTNRAKVFRNLRLPRPAASANPKAMIAKIFR